MLLCIFCMTLFNAYCVFLVCTNQIWVGFHGRWELCWTLCWKQTQTGLEDTSTYSLLCFLGTHNTKVISASIALLFQKRKWEQQIVKIWFLWGPLGYPLVDFSSGLTMCGIANSYFFFLSSPEQTMVSKKFDCAYISVLEGYNGTRKPGWCHLATSDLKYAYYAYCAYFTYFVYYTYIWHFVHDRMAGQNRL